MLPILRDSPARIQDPLDMVDLNRSGNQIIIQKAKNNNHWLANTFIVHHDATNCDATNEKYSKWKNSNINTFWGF